MPPYSQEKESIAKQKERLYKYENLGKNLDTAALRQARIA